jgi:hypothetical protein
LLDLCFWRAAEGDFKIEALKAAAAARLHAAESSPITVSPRQMTEDSPLQQAECGVQ